MKKILLSVFICIVLIAHPKAQGLKGIITDETNNNPIAMAHIQVLNYPMNCVSDEQGIFQLNDLPVSELTLLFTSIGFENKIIEINTDTSNNLEINLHPSVMHLNQAVIITAKRYQQSEFELPESITTINQNQILDKSARTTPEILMGESGVWVQKTNHGGGSVFVRGLTGNQVLLLIDGIRLNNSTYRYGPNQYLNTIDPLTLQQIEVVKGAGSVQYGSDAMGGAVHLLTQNPNFTEKPKLSGSVLLKYLNLAMEQSGRATLEYSSQKLGILGGFTYSNFGDLVAGEGIGKQTPSGYKQWAFDIKARWMLNKRQTLTLAHQSLQQIEVPVFHKVQLENFALNYFDPQSRHLSYMRWEYIGTSKLAQKISITGFWNQTIEGRISQKNNSTTRVEEKDKVNTLGFNVEIQSELSKVWKASSGIELYDDQVSSQKNEINLTQNTSTAKRGLYPDDSKAMNMAIFSLHTFELHKFRISAGLRFNAFRISVKDETLGVSVLQPQALVGNLGVQYFLHPQHQLIATVNSAFRAPNVDDLGTLGIVDNRYEIPTFDLKPEKSWNYEIGYKAQVKNFATKLAFFRNELQDLIVRVKSSYNGQTNIDGRDVYQKENLTRAYIQGLELDFEVKLAKALLLSANLTYTYGQDETNSEPLRRIPPLNGRIVLHYQMNKSWWAKIENNFADKQNRLAKGDKADNRINPNGTPGWNIIHLSTGYKWKFIQVQAGLQNIFNLAYRMHGSGVDGYGRSLWISTKINF